jgi:hypothetical protein
MGSLAGFIAGAVIARENGASDDDVAKFGIIGSLFPSPLLGAVVVKGLTDSSSSGDSQTTTETITVTVPASTPSTAQVYLAGTLSVLDSRLVDWQPDGIAMTRVDGTHWTTELTGPGGAKLEYKFTLGDFDSVEKDSHCDEIANRTLAFPADGTPGNHADTVANWRGLGPCDPAAIAATAPAAAGAPVP